jgi:hypothetical protein
MEFSLPQNSKSYILFSFITDFIPISSQQWKVGLPFKFGDYTVNGNIVTSSLPSTFEVALNPEARRRDSLGVLIESKRLGSCEVYSAYFNDLAHFSAFIPQSVIFNTFRTLPAAAPLPARGTHSVCVFWDSSGEIKGLNFFRDLEAAYGEGGETVVFSLYRIAVSLEFLGSNLSAADVESLLSQNPKEGGLDLSLLLGCLSAGWEEGFEYFIFGLSQEPYIIDDGSKQLASFAPGVQIPVHVLHPETYIGKFYHF